MHDFKPKAGTGPTGKLKKYGRYRTSFSRNSYFIVSFKLKTCSKQSLALSSQCWYHLVVYKQLMCDSGYNSYL